MSPFCMYMQVHAIRESQDGGGSKSTGFLARLAKKIRDNLEIHIKNFRVNIVDNRSPRDGKAYRLKDCMHTHTVNAMPYAYGTPAICTCYSR